MSLLHMPPVRDVWEPATFAGADHPMRKVTRQVAFDGGWDAERAAKVAALFDSMADQWTADHDLEGRYWPLADALERTAGLVDSDGLAVELGSGTGLGTRLLAERFNRVAALDLSAGMLRNAPRESGARVQADSSSLPVRDGSADVVVLVNMLLFPAEVDRVLASAGHVIWVNTMGDQTPIHLPPQDVLDALPGDWTGTTSHAGFGTWLSATRA